jgi:hypothetical protein
MGLTRKFDHAIRRSFHADFDWYDGMDRVQPPELAFYGYFRGLETGKMVGGAMIRGWLKRPPSRDALTQPRHSRRGAIVLRKVSGENALIKDRVPPSAMLTSNGGSESLETWLPSQGNPALADGILTAGDHGVYFDPRPLKDKERVEKVEFLPVDPSAYLAACGIITARFNQAAVEAVTNRVQCLAQWEDMRRPFES